MAGDGEEQFEVHVEKESDDEEIQARNEVIISINEYNNEYNANKNITLKDKNLGVKQLLELAKETLREDFRVGHTSTGKKDKGPGMS